MVTSKLLMLKLTIMSLVFYQVTDQNQTNRSEFYSSVVSMELLLKSELAILDRLDAFIAESEKQIEFLKLERERFREEVKGAAGNPIAYVSNPISAFLMTKRLVKDYRDIDALIRQGVGVEVMEASTVLPTEGDFQGVAEGLSRLQDVYRLEASELAKGDVYGHMLNSEECYLIGRAMVQGKYFTNANQWFREALQRLKTDGNSGVNKVQLLDYYSFSLSENGEYEVALELTEELLKLDPAHAEGIAKMKIIEEWLEYIQENRLEEVTQRENSQNLYESLCRGDYQGSASQTSQLYCRYQTDSSFLLYAPLKLEVVNLDPLVTIYHDVASDREIAKIVVLAKPRVSRATVRDGNEQAVSKARTSQNAWLTDDNDPVVTMLTRRIQYMTGGLNVRSYEMLQVNNYGIGGHYLPHYDWSMEEVPYEGLGVGNRIATVMFYLSDVEAGGATVFPKLGLAVFPRKGSAILWYNLYRNGQGDRRTIHAACPVLSGSKWVANQWIHEYHQEFVRPCGLNSDE